jgi:ring-1,2-phenylacetyl-CoA epoxidase subunit PaaB
MKIKSLDPRVSRLELDVVDKQPDAVLHVQDHWETYQVFHQRKRGEKHSSVGIVHAPSAEMAYDDYDVFATTPDKMYRDPAGYKVNDKIAEFKKSNLHV